MKIAWLILLISAFTDFIITATGGAVTVFTVYVTVIQNAVSAGKTPEPITISWILFMPSILLGLAAMARTIQQKLNANPVTTAALKGEAAPIVIPATTTATVTTAPPAGAPAGTLPTTAVSGTPTPTPPGVTP